MVYMVRGWEASGYLLVEVVSDCRDGIFVAFQIVESFYFLFYREFKCILSEISGHLTNRPLPF